MHNYIVLKLNQLGLTPIVDKVSSVDISNGLMYGIVSVPRFTKIINTKLLMLRVQPRPGVCRNASTLNYERLPCEIYLCTSLSIPIANTI